MSATGLRRSIATVSLSGTLEEKLHAAALAGFDGIEVFEADLLGCPWSPAEVRSRCGDLGLRVELFQPVRDLEAVPRAQHAAVLARARAKVRLAAALGAPMLLACSSVRPDAIDDDDLAAQDLDEIGEIAAESGIRIAYEALSWGRHVHSYGHSWKIVQSAANDNVGVCIDSFHVLSVGDALEAIAEIDAGKIFFLQLADAPEVSMDLLQWSRHHRCFPGQGSFDLVDFTAQVLTAGYDGPLSLEVFNDVIRRSDANATAADAMRSLLALEDGLGRSGAGAPAIPTAWRERLRLLPNAVAPMRVSAADVRADASVAVGIESVLARMGFEEERIPDEWGTRQWSLGRLDLTVRRVRSGAVDGDAVIEALTLECAEPAGIARRARALLTPCRPARRPPAEELSAPSGLVLRLCGAGVGDSAPNGPRPHVQGIDHLVVTVGEDEFDETLLFVRSVLGLGIHSSEELASPDGLVRSRAFAAPAEAHGCGVRLALNARDAQRSSAHHAREHLAFACDDIFAVAWSWRAAGVPLLTIPDNYYDDLEARLGVDAQRIGALRELSILYDRDDAGREFHHCYTEAIGSRFFFELVQRTPGYDGYGATNAAVRMSAQRWRERAAATS